MNEDIDSRITRISRQIVESYNEIGGINHISGPNLPSRLGVVSILKDLETLIFPGFQSEQKLENDLICYTIGAKTRRLVRELTTEISRSLEHAYRSDEDKREKIKPGSCRREAEKTALDLLEEIPGMRWRIMGDVQAAFRGDPAAKSFDEVILAYPGLEAIACYRIAHKLYEMNVPLIPRMMSEHIHGKTGIDIHPGASIGSNFFIDHATGVVIGETAVIGDNVKVYQGVTIGALSVDKKLANSKRHPTIEDNVTIYAGATILGGNTVIGKGSVIGGNVWITESVPPDSVVYNKTTEYKLKSKTSESGSRSV